MASTLNASNSGAGGLISTADASGVLQLQTAGTTAVTIDTSQRAAFVAGTEALPAITTTGDTNTGMWFPAADTIAASTAGSERMRIASGGQVIIAGTSAIGSARFGIYGGSAVGDDCWSTKPITNITYNPAVFYNNANTFIGYIQCSTSGTTFSTTSDYRLKENIVPMIGALDKVLQLKPVTYKWKADGSDGQGFIAHELQAVVPDCVTGEKDAVETYTDEKGNEQTRIKPQGVDTSFLVATLTAAIQEQQTIINDLKARVTALEAK